MVLLPEERCFTKYCEEGKGTDKKIAQTAVSPIVSAKGHAISIFKRHLALSPFLSAPPFA